MTEFTACLALAAIVLLICDRYHAGAWLWRRMK
jgi:hypothetical protein